MTLSSTMRLLLFKMKYPLPMVKQSRVVYEVSCECGKVNIGETRDMTKVQLAGLPLLNKYGFKATVLIGVEAGYWTSRSNCWSRKHFTSTRLLPTTASTLKRYKLAGCYSGHKENGRSPWMLLCGLVLHCARCTMIRMQH